MYDEVVAQVIDKNYAGLQRMREHLTSLLQTYNSRRTQYLDELDRLSKRLDSTGSGSLRGDLEAKMSVIRTTISKVEASITRYENQLEKC